MVCICYLKNWNYGVKKNSRKAKRVCSFIRKFRVGTMYIIRRSFNYAYFLSYAYWFQEWRIGAHHSSFNLLHTSCNRIECCIFGHHCHGGAMHHIMGQNNFWSTGYGNYGLSSFQGQKSISSKKIGLLNMNKVLWKSPSKVRFMKKKVPWVVVVPFIFRILVHYETFLLGHKDLLL